MIVRPNRIPAINVEAAVMIIRSARVLRIVFRSPKGCKSGWEGSLEIWQNFEKADW